MVQKGFTLIELMIVVAIIGILAALAIPAYQDYVARSQASEGLTITDGIKVAIQEHYADLGVCPNNVASDATTYGIDDDENIDGSYVLSVQVGADDASAAYCGMLVTYRGAGEVASKLTDETLYVVGNLNAGTEVDWICNGDGGWATAPGGISGDAGSLLTTAPEILPSACKP
ncbi:pilin [Marinobacterium aestuariivivens]|uniref:Pilin n=1 Tax=Marinobacterium aestuariivivens TaxID=1698799 RepID=A0ABW1ZWH0_9GAMM